MSGELATTGSTIAPISDYHNNAAPLLEIRRQISFMPRSDEMTVAADDECSSSVDAGKMWPLFPVVAGRFVLFPVRIGPVEVECIGTRAEGDQIHVGIEK